MPLPSNGAPWPPKQLDRVGPSMERWSAWYSGEVAELERAYRGDHAADRPVNRPSTYRGGLVGAVGRMFWGAPRTDLTQTTKAKLHVPLAADICQASADLLFAEPPTITVEDAEQGVQDRLAEIVDDGMLGTFAEAAELAAALGGVYLRVTWDDQVRPDGPFLTAVDADGAYPEFRWGKLTAVTFWTVVSDPNDAVVLRHLERHEIAGGIGVVRHGLYQGDRDNLGRAVTLNDSTATAALADQVTDGDLVSTQSPGLAVVYVPNQRPQRAWRHDPLGRNLGRSDLQGVEGLMDALDETYTSWMRDIRLGKSRVFIARSMLEDLGPGQGAAWDSDREVYSPLNALAPRETSGLPIEAHQFKIRVDEHAQTSDKLIEAILRTAGYSVQTFGMDDGNSRGAATATEIQAKQSRSFMTRDRKIRLWRPAITDVLEKLLAVDAAVFKRQVTPARPTVQFSDGVQDSQLALAQTAVALSTARAASTKTLVEMLHPDWDDTQVSDEVTLIKTEQQVAAPDPSTFDGLGSGLGISGA